MREGSWLTVIVLCSQDNIWCCFLNLTVYCSPVLLCHSYYWQLSVWRSFNSHSIYISLSEVFQSPIKNAATWIHYHDICLILKQTLYISLILIFILCVGYYRSLYIMVNNRLPASLEYSGAPTIPLASTLLEHILKPLHFTYSSSTTGARYVVRVKLEVRTCQDKWKNSYIKLWHHIQSCFTSLHAV